MNRVLFLVLIFILGFQLGYSFEIYDSNGYNRDYFSIDKSEVFIETLENVSSLTISELNKSNFFLFNLSSCALKKCANFSLLDLIDNINSPLLKSRIFFINLSNSEKMVYLDFEKPKFNLFNWSISSLTEKLYLNYNYSDNFDNIKSLKLYINNNSNLEFIADIKDFTDYSLDLKSAGELILLFKIEDFSGNILELEKNFTINDFSSPKILDFRVISNFSKYKLEFLIEDENLSRYEIYHPSITLSKNLAVSSFMESLDIPFDEGLILFKVIDQNQNQVNLSFNLDSSIFIDYQNKYYNSNRFQFTSSANNCHLDSMDLNSINNNFIKSGTTFYYDLSVNQNKNYTLEFYCELDNLKEYFSYEFIYDTINPNYITLKSNKTEDGDIDLYWSKSFDLQGEIFYVLYKNNVELYSGTKLKYSDSKVVYPKTYTYYLKVFDKAGNSIETNTISQIPKKLLINYETDLKLETVTLFSNLNFNIKTDLGSNIFIKVINDGIFVDEKILNSVGEISYINVNLLDGVNELNVKIMDDFSNEVFYKYYITYNEPTIIETEIVADLIKPEEVLSLNNENSINLVNSSLINDSVVNANSTRNSSNNSLEWVWFLFWLILILVFIWKFILNEYKLDSRHSKISNINNKNRLKNTDLLLKKNLKKVKIEREKKIQDKILNEKNKIENLLKPRSSFLKLKLSDLSKDSKKLNFNLKDKVNFISKSNFNESKLKISNCDDNLKERKIVKKINSKPFLKSIFKKEKILNDSSKDLFLDYIKKKNKEVSWDSPREYILKQKINDENDLKLDSMQIVNNESSFSKIEKNEQKNQVSSDFDNKLVDNGEDDLNKGQMKFIKKDKLNLDSYLKKRKNNKSSYFIEKDIDKNLRKL